MNPSRRSLVFALAAGALAGCTGAGGESATASHAPSPVAVTEAPAAVACANPEGGACLNDLDAGTYTTVEFEPALTYTVPEGWFNGEDLYGNFLLLMPENVTDGWQANYIGVYRSPRVPTQPCEETIDTSIAGTVDSLVGFYQGSEALDVVADEPVSIGGLDGRRLDLALADDWTGTCPFSRGEPVMAFGIGSNGSGFHHVITEDIPVRLYLLEWGDSAIGIEVSVDAATTEYDEYMALAEPVIESFDFDVAP